MLSVKCSAVTPLTGAAEHHRKNRWDVWVETSVMHCLHTDSALRRPLIWRTHALPLCVYHHNQCHTTPNLIATFKLTSVKSLETYSRSDYSGWVCFILYSFQWSSKSLLTRFVCAELRMQLQHVSLPPCMIKHDIMKWPWLSLPE